MPLGIFDFISFVLLMLFPVRTTRRRTWRHRSGTRSSLRFGWARNSKSSAHMTHYLRNAVAANAAGRRWNGERRMLQQDGGLRVRDVLVNLKARSVREQGCERGLIKVFNKLGCSRSDPTEKYLCHSDGRCPGHGHDHASPNAVQIQKSTDEERPNELS